MKLFLFLGLLLSTQSIAAEKMVCKQVDGTATITIFGAKIFIEIPALKLSGERKAFSATEGPLKTFKTYQEIMNTIEVEEGFGLSHNPLCIPTESMGFGRIDDTHLETTLVFLPSKFNGCLTDLDEEGLEFSDLSFICEEQ